MKQILLTLSLALLLTGCPSNDPEGGNNAAVSDLQTGKPAQDDPNIKRGKIGTSALDDPSHPDYKNLQQRTIYFDYDSDAIKEQYVPIVEAHARFLRDNGTRKLQIQGHADERGSREYNLALGQRRADAVKSRLTLLGAKSTQIESVSFGEEKSSCADASEDCFAKNRRGDLIYQ